MGFAPFIALGVLLIALWTTTPALAAGDAHVLDVICYVDDRATAIAPERLEDPVVEVVDAEISVVLTDWIACIDIDRTVAPVLDPPRLEEHYGSLPTVTGGFDRNAIVQCGSGGAAFAGVSSRGAQSQPPTGPASLSRTDFESIIAACAGSLGPGLKDRGSFEFLNGPQPGFVIGSADCGGLAGGPYANGEGQRTPALSLTEVALSFTGHWAAMVGAAYLATKEGVEGTIAKVGGPGLVITIANSAAADVQKFMMQSYKDAAADFATAAGIHAGVAETVARTAQSGTKDGTDAKKHADAAAAAAAEARRHADAAKAASQRAQTSTDPKEISAALREAAEAEKKAAEATQRAIDEAKKAEEAKKREEEENKTTEGGTTSGQTGWPALGDGACEAFNYFLWECQQAGWQTGPCQKFLQDLTALKCGWGIGGDPAPIDPVPDGPAVTCELEPVTEEQVATAWLNACGSEVAYPEPGGDPCGPTGLFTAVVMHGDIDGCDDEVANTDGHGCSTPPSVEVEAEDRCPPTPPDVPPSPCVENDPIGPGPFVIVTPGSGQIGPAPSGAPITGTPQPVAPTPQEGSSPEAPSGGG